MLQWKVATVAILLFLVTIIPSDAVQYSYKCLPGWVYGNNCGKHFCYRAIPVPDASRVFMVEQNYCAHLANGAMPASIHCNGEQDFMFKGDLLQQTKGSVGIGVFIPSTVPWSRTNWRNRDGTPYDYQRFRKNGGIPKDEPNGGDLYNNPFEKIAIASRDAWADFQPFRIERLLCKMAATVIVRADPTKPPTPKPTPKTTKATPKPTAKPTTKPTTKKTTPKPTTKPTTIKTTPKPTTKPTTIKTTPKPTTKPTTIKTTPKPTTRMITPKPTTTTTTRRTTTTKIPQSCYV